MRVIAVSLCRLPRLRQRHWLVIGVGVGLAIASVVVLWPGLFAARLGQDAFEQAVTSDPIAGNPPARRVIVHARPGYSFVTLECLTPEEGGKATAGNAYRYVRFRFDPKQPYQPKSAPSQIVDLRINPGAAADAQEAGDMSGGRGVALLINGSPVEAWPSRVSFKGWSTRDDGRSGTPDDGAEADIGMRYGDYQVFVQLDSTQGQMPLADHLTLRLNDHPLPPLVRTDDQTVWRTQVSRSEFKINERQSLRFAVHNAAVRITQIRFADPRYTVMDYLAYVKGRSPDFDYEVGWIDDPSVAFPLFGGAGAFLIGLVFPAIARVIIRTREMMLLAKAKRLSAMSTLLPGSPKLTLEDWFQLVDLIAALETSLREVLVEQAVAVGLPLGGRAEPSPAETFVQRAEDEPVEIPEQAADKQFGCKDDDVYPTELGAAAGAVVCTSADLRERDLHIREMLPPKTAKKA